MTGGSRVHDGETPFSVGTMYPDPLFDEIHQEFWTKQGVGGSQSGPVQGPVPEKSYNGARYGPGLEMGWIRKRGG